MVSVRDVVAVLQRGEMVRRIAEELETYIIELGVDARLIRLQLDEILGDLEDDRWLVIQDYLFDPDIPVDDALEELASIETDDLLDVREAPGSSGCPATWTSSRTSSPGATGCWPRCRACPRASSTTSSIASAASRRSCGHPPRPRRRPGRRRGPSTRHQGRAVAPGRVEHPRPLLLTVWETSPGMRDRRCRPGTPAELRTLRGGRPECAGSSSPRTSSACGRCSTTCAQRIALEQGWTVVVAVEPFPGRELARRWRCARTRSASLDDAAVAARPASQPPTTGCERVGGVGFCMGGMVRPQGCRSPARFDRASSASTG